MIMSGLITTASEERDGLLVSPSLEGGGEGGGGQGEGRGGRIKNCMGRGVGKAMGKDEYVCERGGGQWEDRLGLGGTAPSKNTAEMQHGSITCTMRRWPAYLTGRLHAPHVGVQCMPCPARWPCLAFLHPLCWAQCHCARTRPGLLDPLSGSPGCRDPAQRGTLPAEHRGKVWPGRESLVWRESLALKGKSSLSCHTWRTGCV